MDSSKRKRMNSDSFNNSKNNSKKIKLVDTTKNVRIKIDKLSNSNLKDNNLHTTQSNNISSLVENVGVKESSNQISETINHTPGKNILQMVKLFEGDQISSDTQCDNFQESKRLSMNIFKELLLETEELKNTNAMRSLNVRTLVRFLKIMEVFIRASEQNQKLDSVAQNNANEKEEKIISRKIVMSTISCIVCLNIMISEGSPKCIYVDEVIDSVINHVINQMRNSHQNKNIKNLNVKLVVCFENLCDLLKTKIVQLPLVIKLFSACVTSIFISENVDWFLEVGLMLVAIIFGLHRNLRKTFWSVILQPISIQSLSSCLSESGLQKCSLASQKISDESGNEIHTFTLLITNLLQGLTIYCDNQDNKLEELEYYNNYQEVVDETEYFVKLFLKTCISGSNDHFQKDFLGIVLKDILELINKPECPVSGLVLKFLGKHLTELLVKKCLDPPVLYVLLNFVTDIALKLVVKPPILEEKKEVIEMLLGEILNNASTEDISKCNPNLEGAMDDFSSVHKNRKCQDDDDYIEILKNLEGEERKLYVLRRTMLDLFGPKNTSSAKLFYLLQWLHEVYDELPKTESISAKNKNTKSKRSKREPVKIEKVILNKRLLALERIKGFLLKSLSSTETKRRSFISLIDLRRARDILKGVAFILATEKCDADKYVTQKCESRSENPRTQNFSNCLNAILEVTLETSTVFRVKALKSLASLIHVEPSLLELDHVKTYIDIAISDEASSMGEAAIELMGTYVLDNNEIFNKYFAILLSRLSNSGPGLKKKILKLFIGAARRNSKNIVEMGMKVLPKIHDEESVQKLVLEFFEYLLCSTSESNDIQTRLNEVIQITCCDKNSFDDFLEIVNKLCCTRGENFSKTCSKLIQRIFKIVSPAQNIVSGTSPTNELNKGYYGILYSFAKAKPELMATYIQKIQYCLKVPCGDDQLLYLTKILAISLSFAGKSHKSERKLFENLIVDLLHLICNASNNCALKNCVKCLAAIVNKVTQNYDVVRKKFISFHSYLNLHERWIKENKPCKDKKHRAILCRSLFVTGLMLRYFDFEHADISHDIQVPQKVFRDIMFFLTYETSKCSSIISDDSKIKKNSKLENKEGTVINKTAKKIQNDESIDDGNTDIKTHALKALGSICVRHDRFMLENSLNLFYKEILKDGEMEFKCIVLENIEDFLKENEKRILEDDRNWSSKAKHTNLRELEDKTYERARLVIQSYLTEMLNSYFKENVRIRKVVSVIVQMTLRLGLVYPVQIIPHLVAMATDEAEISRYAIKYLLDLDMKYSSFIQAKAGAGFLMSFKLHKILEKNEVARGFFLDGTKKAKNELVYTMLNKNCQQRRALILNILKQFDKTDNSLSFKIYLTDNMSKFPYKIQDEVLFLLYHINTSLLVLGSNILQSLKTVLEPDECENKGKDQNQENENNKAQKRKKVSKRYKELQDQFKEVNPEEKIQLQKHLQDAQGCVLLWKLKNYLQRSYDGITDAKIRQYSPLEDKKLYDKFVSRKGKTDFNPKDVLNKIRDTNFVKQYLEFKTFMSDLVDDSDTEVNDEKSGDNSDGGEYLKNSGCSVEKAENETTVTEKITLGNSILQNSVLEKSATEHLVTEDSIGESSTKQVRPKKIDKVKNIFFARRSSRKHKKNIHKYMSESELDIEFSDSN